MKTDLPCPGSPSKKLFKSLLTSIWSRFKISKIIGVNVFRTNCSVLKPQVPFCEERVRSDLVFSFRPVALSLIDQSSSQITEEVFTSLRQRTPCQTRGEYLSGKNWECRFWIFGILKLSARMFIGFFLELSIRSYSHFLMMKTSSTNLKSLN